MDNRTNGRAHDARSCCRPCRRSYHIRGSLFDAQQALTLLTFSSVNPTRKTLPPPHEKRLGVSTATPSSVTGKPPFHLETIPYTLARIPCKTCKTDRDTTSGIAKGTPPMPPVA